MEKSHHRSKNPVSGSRLMQNPWKHSAWGALRPARSASTVSSLGIRLKARNRARMTANSTMPMTRFFFSAVSNIHSRSSAMIRQLWGLLTFPVIPAKAGIQQVQNEVNVPVVKPFLGSCESRNDGVFSKCQHCLGQLLRVPPGCADVMRAANCRQWRGSAPQAPFIDSR